MRHQTFPTFRSAYKVRPPHLTAYFSPISLLALTISWAVTNCVNAVNFPPLLQESKEERVDDAWFEKRIEPLLKSRCLECHSHEAGNMEGGLALDSKSGWKTGGDNGPAIVPNSPQKSLLFKAINHVDGLEMPPEDKLTAAEIKLLETWIKNGAPDPRQTKLPADLRSNPRDWWSLRPLKRPALPVTPPDKTNLFANPIDLFVEKKLKAHDLSFAPPAKPAVLLRRLYFTLHGLPPTPEQMDKYDYETLTSSKSRRELWDQQILTLLKSPRYGERWARHWLDTVHFADTNGCEHDTKRPNAWPYRDYVIQSFNNDKLWPRFVKEQLAADHFYPEQSELTPALGFISAGPLELSRAGTAPVTFDYLDRDDIVSQVMAAFTSTTANCARCHDHKFDPISQEDYYSLQAVFAGGGKGDREFDSDPRIRRQRNELKRQQKRVQQKSLDLLNDPANQKLVSTFEASVAKESLWIPLDMTSFVSEQGATLKQLDDGSVLASGKSPDKDLYTVKGTGTGAGSGKGGDRKLKKVSAVRLDVLPHASLPTQGPGRCANGNLHLNLAEFLLVDNQSKKESVVEIKSASADWNQSGWTIEHAIDKNPGSAWGIYPEVSKPHHAVFQFKQPVSVGPNTTLIVKLHQTHGGSHLIGRFRLYVTDSENQSVRVLPDSVRQSLAVPEAQRTQAQKLELAVYVLQLDLDKKQAALPTPQMVYAWSRYYSHAKKQAQPLAPKTVHVLKRGNIHRPGKVAVPGTLSVVGELNSRFDNSVEHNESFRRAALANWMTHPDNPLVWRSIVNRVWAFHFGKGLCDTPNDFGRMGSKPSHPELLDWLAVWFRDEAKGSIKKLHRLILTSRTWQQASTGIHPELQKKASQKDSGNSLLWKSQLRKLDAESFRDSVLQIAGEIDFTMSGPGVEQFSKSKGRQTTPQLDYDAFDWNSKNGKRRSIYRVVWRGIADPLMESLDFPDLGLLTGKRETSSSPLQALATFNHDFVLHFSSVLAQKLKRENKTVEAQVERACRLIWLRPPTTAEKTALNQYAEKHSLAALCRVLINSNEFIFIR